jgi:hypothetical protein
MTKLFSAVAAATWLCASAALAAPATAPLPESVASPAATVRKIPTDISAARRHYRYVGNRWRVVQPYPSYGYYGPRPRFYRPYPYYIPIPFGFGFGYDPNY